MSHCTREPNEPKEVFSISYYSGGGRLFVHQSPEQDRPFVIYLQDEGHSPRYFERHQTQANAESVSRWMASGL